MPETDRTPDPAGARRFCADLAETVDVLIKVLDEETRLVKAAKLTAAAELGAGKAAASERYLRAFGTLRDSAPDLGRLAPDEVGHLRERHQALELAISQNLAVLATARTVSETLIRGIADIAGAKTAGPRTYRADGQHADAAPRSAPFSYTAAL